MFGVSNKPKRPMSAYMLWLNSVREQIKSENPGLKVTEIAKKGGEIWREMTDKSVWEEKAAKAMEQYTRNLEIYNANRVDDDEEEQYVLENLKRLGMIYRRRRRWLSERNKVKRFNAFRVHKPKRPMSAYMLWLNSAREQIKSENPGLKVTEIAKKGGEIWREMTDKSVWEDMAAKAREQYTKDLESFNANEGDGEGDAILPD